MPPPERMLSTIQKAIEHGKFTPGRQGYSVFLEGCKDVLVAGDLHGHIVNFQHVLKAADLAANPGRHLVLQEVIHSSFRYPNGGDKSHQLLDLYCALKCQFPERVHLIPGNHEMAQVQGRRIGKGDEIYNDVFIDGVKQAYGTAWKEILKAYYDLILSLPIAIRTPNRVFISHSLPPGRQIAQFDASCLVADKVHERELQPGGMVYGILWGRDTTEDTAWQFLRKVDADLLISGHIPTTTGFETPNSMQLIVDCSETPAAFVLFPTDRPLKQAELIAGMTIIKT